MKSIPLAVFLVLLLAGSAAASTVDFRNETTFGGALNQTSFFDGNTITVTAMPNGARLWWDSTDGFGVQYGYEKDEIESVERLKIGFSTPVHLSSVLITDLFNEGYLERGSYQLNESGNWIYFSALASQTPSSSNGELTVPIDPNVWVNSITFRAPGQLLFQAHEFSVAAIETTAAPIPASAWLLVSGLLGLVAIRRRLKK